MIAPACQDGKYKALATKELSEKGAQEGEVWLGQCHMMKNKELEVLILEKRRPERTWSQGKEQGLLLMKSKGRTKIIKKRNL